MDSFYLSCNNFLDCRFFKFLEQRYSFVDRAKFALIKLLFILIHRSLVKRHLAIKSGIIFHALSVLLILNFFPGLIFIISQGFRPNFRIKIILLFAIFTDLRIKIFFNFLSLLDIGMDSFFVKSYKITLKLFSCLAKIYLSLFSADGF